MTVYVMVLLVLAASAIASRCEDRIRTITVMLSNWAILTGVGGLTGDDPNWMLNLAADLLSGYVILLFPGSRWQTLVAALYALAVPVHIRFGWSGLAVDPNYWDQMAFIANLQLLAFGGWLIHDAYRYNHRVRGWCDRRMGVAAQVRDRLGLPRLPR